MEMEDNMDTIIRHENQMITTENDPIVAWWSFAKTIIATAALKLVEKGELSLDSKYYGLEGNLKELLNHHSGLTDYEISKAYHQAVSRGDQAWTFEELMEEVNGYDLIAKPGDKFRYSNIGYYYIRKLIEEKMAMSLDEAIQVLLFDALEIEFRVGQTINDLSFCDYGIIDDYDPKWVYHGMFMGKLSHAVTFLNCLMRGDILKDETLLLMKDTEVFNFDVGDRPWQVPGYALGLMVNKEDNERYCLGHTGAGPGSVLAIYHFPSTSKALTVGCVMAADDQSLVENQLMKIAMSYHKKFDIISN